MISYQTTQALWSELSSGTPAAAATRSYFASRTRNALYNFVLSKFAEAKGAGLTQAELARRMGSRPEAVNRYLASPGNWELSTLSALLLGITGEELVPGSRSVVGRTRRNRTALDLLVEKTNRSAEPSSDTVLGEKNGQYIRPGKLDDWTAV